MNPRTVSRIAAAPRALSLSLCCLVLLATSSHAQGGWNRHVEAVSVTPAAAPAGGDSFFDICAVWSAHLDDAQSAPFDLTTEVELSINGTVVASSVTQLGGDPGSGFCTDGGGACGGSCGTGSVNGASLSLLCLEDGPCTGPCDCHCSFPSIASLFPSQPMEPGDEITVLLRPAPGALPEIDTSDDVEMLSFDGDAVFWNRVITSVEIDDVPGGPGVYEVRAEGVVQFSGLQRYADAAGEVHLGMEALLQVNGTVVASTTIPFDPLPWFNTCGCTAVCGMVNGAELLCQQEADQCVCEGTWGCTFPPLPLTIDDEVVIILRPVPGALPELPGLDEDDELDVLCCGPTDVAVVAPDNGAIALHQNQPNPFRGSTQIAFDAKPGAPVTLAVYDIHGRRVRTLLEGERSAAGGAAVTWDGTNAMGEPVPSGVYFYRVQADGVAQTRKMTLAK